MNIPDSIQFEFQGNPHTVELLSSPSSTNVVFKVDGVMHRLHVTLAAGVDPENWLDDTALIDIAKEAIDPEYGVLTSEEIEELRRECGLDSAKEVDERASIPDSDRWMKSLTKRLRNRLRP